MSSGIKQPDGTTCYVGVGCSRHAAYNATTVRNTPADEIKRQIMGLMDARARHFSASGTVVVLAAANPPMPSAEQQIAAINDLAELLEAWEEPGSYHSPDYEEEEIDQRIIEHTADELNFDASDPETKTILKQILRDNKKEFLYEEVHYRMYYSESRNAYVPICVQYFDYPDYKADRFVGKTYFETEDDAQEAIEYLTQKVLKIA